MSTVITLTVVILVAIFTSVTAPLILAYRTERMHREDRLSDYERQDEAARLLKAEQTAQAEAAQRAADDLVASQGAIAAQAAEAAGLLLAAQRESIARTDEVDRLAAVRAAKTGEKLDQIGAQARRIHTLVNSDMTAARQSELDQTRAIAVVLRRVISMAANHSQDPDPRDVEALEAATRRAGELEAILADRFSQMQEVQAEAVRVGLEGGIQPEDGPGAHGASAGDKTEGA